MRMTTLQEKATEGKFANIKRGWFDINGQEMFFRSIWEANYALYLDFLVKIGEIRAWKYEARTFLFDKIITGTRTYKPDFEVLTKNGSIEYHEVKGWMTPKSNTQLKRMKKYHPKVKVIVIDQKAYTDIKNKIGKMLKFY